MPAMKQTTDNSDSDGDIIAAQIDVIPADDKETEKDLFINGKDKLIKASDQQSAKMTNHTKENSKKKSIVLKPTTLEKPTKNDEDEWEYVPPDGNWGWLILFGSTLVNLLIPGTIKSFGVLFVEFIETFEATPAAAAWIPALCYFLYSSLGPLSSILSVKYSYRTVTLIGGAFAATGMIISFWASSLTYLYISYGVFVGTGAGLSFPPTVYIVTSYFVRLRGLANGICISGSAFGSIILPPILRYLLETFGYRGACLIMGGITLNTLVAALFYEPVENHMKRVPKKRIDKIDADEEDDEGIRLEFTAKHDESMDDTIAAKPKFMITSDDTPAGTPKASITSPDVFKFPKNDENGFARSVSAVVVQNYKGNMEEYRQRKISTPIRESDRNLTFTSNQLSSTPSLYAVPESRMSYSRLSRVNQFRQSGGGGGTKPKRSPSTSSFQYMSTPFHGSTLSIQPQEFASHLSLKSIASSINPVTACTKSGDDTDGGKKVKKGNKFLDLSLLKDPAYLVVLISNSTNAIGYTNFIILLPAYAGSLGFDKNMSAYLLSIVSALDLVGRIGGSALSDVGFIPKTWYFVGGLAISGISLAILPMATTYSLCSFWCACFGLASGTYVGITAVIMADMLGTERLTSSYGISLFVNGVLQLVGPPICGVIYSYIGTFGPLFTTLGLILLGGASLWGFMPFINRNRLRKEEEVYRKHQEEMMIQEENEKELLA